MYYHSICSIFNLSLHFNFLSHWSHYHTGRSIPCVIRRYSREQMGAFFFNPSLLSNLFLLFAPLRSLSFFPTSVLWRGETFPRPYTKDYVPRLSVPFVLNWKRTLLSLSFFLFDIVSRTVSVINERNLLKILNCRRHLLIGQFGDGGQLRVANETFFNEATYLH